MSNRRLSDERRFPKTVFDGELSSIRRENVSESCRFDEKNDFSDDDFPTPFRFDGQSRIGDFPSNRRLSDERRPKTVFDGEASIRRRFDRKVVDSTTLPVKSTGRLRETTYFPTCFVGKSSIISTGKVVDSTTFPVESTALRRKPVSHVFRRKVVASTTFPVESRTLKQKQFSNVVRRKSRRFDNFARRIDNSRTKSVLDRVSPDSRGFDGRGRDSTTSHVESTTLRRSAVENGFRRRVLSILRAKLLNRRLFLSNSHLSDGRCLKTPSVGKLSFFFLISSVGKR